MKGGDSSDAYERDQQAQAVTGASHPVEQHAGERGQREQQQVTLMTPEQLAQRIIEAIPDALGMTPDPWSDEPKKFDGEPHKTVAALIREAAPSLVQAEARPQWQPIETAKKNVPVLVYLSGTAGLGVYRAVLGDWIDGEPKTRWRPVGYTALDDFPTGANITHWMPLPPTPEP